MRQGYVFKHWILTLLIGPFTYQVNTCFFGEKSLKLLEILEFYPLFLIAGMLFSSPTFFVCLACFYFLSKNNVKWTTVKVILILVAIIGANITMAFMKGSLTRDLILAYSITTLIVGLSLKIKYSNTNTQESLSTRI
jgi:hypothetical protein